MSQHWSLSELLAIFYKGYDPPNPLSITPNPRWEGRAGGGDEG